jgi:peroxiredoxin
MNNLRFGCLLSLLLLAPCVAVAQPADDDAARQEAARNRPPIDPFFILIRDRVVREKLDLTAQQTKAVDALLREHNGLLLAIRDVGPLGAPESVQLRLRDIRGQVERMLDERQRIRLAGLVLQAQGYDALLLPALAAELKLQPVQQQQLADIQRDFLAKVEPLQKPNADRSAEQRQQALDAANRERQRRVLAVLDERQTRTWAERLGEPFDFSILRSGPAWAPEFNQVETWLNSSPLRMESLRGRVVVVHFFTFGCINCIRNYPWYREWQEAFQGRDVTIIGIHTPETEPEADVARLREKLRDNDLKFPVAIDSERQLWQAWSNSIWPSVYLTDKQGRVRYWWYGELDWEGAGGQHLARKRIEELLAESP